MVVVFQAAVGDGPLFVRGEGPTRAAAEAAAWAQYQQHLAPDHTHRFRAVPHSLGDGVCSVCGVFVMDVFDHEGLAQEPTTVPCGTAPRPGSSAGTD